MYATDRRPTAPTTEWTLPRDDCKFQEVRNPRGLTYGVALVASPVAVSNNTKAEHFACLHIEPLQDAKKIEQSAVELAHRSFRDLFLYVHGYGTTFGRAAEVAAFMSTSLSIKNVPMIFSWPSKKPEALTYLSAEEQLEESRDNLKSVLKLTTNFQSANTHVLGHSLGARGPLEAIAELRLSKTSDLKKMRKLILAAADISSQRVDMLWPRFMKPTTQVVVYSSAQDFILSGLSSCLPDRAPRLGQLKEPRSKWKPIDFVHVKQTSMVDHIKWLGNYLDLCKAQAFEGYLRSNLHSYHYHKRSVRDDISHVISGNHDARSPKKNNGVREIE